MTALSNPAKASHETVPFHRGQVYNNILETIGGTPLVRLSKLAKEHGALADVLAKLEFFNPLASVKDRIGFAMIEAAEKSGKLPDRVEWYYRKYRKEFDEHGVDRLEISEEF